MDLKIRLNRVLILREALLVVFCLNENYSSALFSIIHKKSKNSGLIFLFHILNVKNDSLRLLLSFIFMILIKK